MSRSWRCGGGVLAACLLAASAAHGVPGFKLRTLSGEPATATPRIVLFWRADCAPCLLELSDLKALRQAASPLRLEPVGLQDAAALRVGLAKLKLSPADSLITPDDPAAVLTRFGGAPPRLPLAVAFNAQGEVCATHSGLLGRDLVHRWSRSCRMDHA